METAKWMSLLPGETPSCLVNLPGTHDSSTQFIVLPVLFSCQDMSIAAQLETGVRFLDIRLELRDGRFRAVHGIGSCRARRGPGAPPLYFEDIWAMCSAFLAANPGETVFMSVKMDAGDNADIFFAEFFRQHIAGQDLWFLENRYPALGECRGKIVLVRRCGTGSAKGCTDLNTGINLSNWPEQGSTESAEPLRCDIERLDGTPSGLEAVIQDRFRFPGKVKWERAAKPALDAARPGAATLCLHFLSTFGRIAGPKINAKAVNRAFASYPLEPGRNVGWIILDFPTKSLCEKIIASNFQDVL
ncbi:MAG TPA: hypothetical protein PL044_01450 [Clostridiales bacterium]|nr:MAG: 1-phosphatidylinositol phosphodiesterase precursor [Firmicutes bacterium ADurb.Bin262]HOU09995.1 hypothetical protein [Clostridiales bacterium]HQH63700.1 hypothetical protein [Clostridiales bacterium]HQK72435.1 hypothetical protein [Clostridiales bacterium]